MRFDCTDTELRVLWLLWLRANKRGGVLEILGWMNRGGLV